MVQNKVTLGSSLVQLVLHKQIVVTQYWKKKKGS